MGQPSDCFLGRSLELESGGMTGEGAARRLVAEQIVAQRKAVPGRFDPLQQV